MDTYGEVLHIPELPSPSSLSFYLLLMSLQVKVWCHLEESEWFGQAGQDPIMPMKTGPSFHPLLGIYTLCFSCSKTPHLPRRCLHMTRIKAWAMDWLYFWKPLDYSTLYNGSWHLQETTAARPSFPPVLSSPRCRCSHVGPTSTWSRARGCLDVSSCCHDQVSSRQHSHPCQTCSTTLKVLDSLPLSSDSKWIPSAS